MKHRQKAFYAIIFIKLLIIRPFYVSKTLFATDMLLQPKH